MEFLRVALQLAIAADDVLQRRRHLRRVRAAEQQYARVAAWHLAQSENFRQDRDGASLHLDLGLFRQA